MRNLENKLVSVLVYFTDVSQIQELDYSLLTLIGQWHRPLEFRVLCVDLSDEERYSVEKLLANYQNMDEISVAISDVTLAGASLSDIFNSELGKLKGRYVGFLRAQDYLYPNAYQHLLEKLEEENAQIAFGSIRLSNAKKQETHFYYIDSKSKEAYSARDIKTILDQPFYPIHSILIDRSDILLGELFFSVNSENFSIQSLNPRLFTKYKVSFLNPSKIIGETVFFSESDGDKAGANSQNTSFWRRVCRGIWPGKS